MQTWEVGDFWLGLSAPEAVMTAVERQHRQKINALIMAILLFRKCPFASVMLQAAALLRHYSIHQG